jgi:hypothetical protein
MTSWLWILVAVAAYLVFSMVATLTLALILGRIRRAAHGEEEAEAWTMAPLTREQRSAKRARWRRRERV